MPPADVVLRRADVWTNDPDRPRADALAVRSGVIVAVGEQARDLPAAEVRDLAGRTVLPGFRDGHIHPLWGGTERLDAPVAGAADLDDLLGRLARHAAERPEAEWVVGYGYPPHLCPGGTGDAELLDAVVPDRPVALVSSDHHTLWANSRALAAAGIDARAPDPDRGAIDRRPDGSPLGTLQEEAAMRLVTDLIPPKSPADKAWGLRMALAQMAAAGIVSAQEAKLDPDDVAVYLRLAAEGELTADIDVALHARPGAWQRQRAEFAQARRQAEQAPAGALGRVTARTVKLFADGVIEAGTAALSEPYADAPGSRGIAVWDPQELIAAVRAFDADGFDPHIHAIGDAAVASALDAIDATRRQAPGRDRRPVIAHCQLVRPEHLPRFASAGAIANLEPLWARPSAIMTDLTEPRLGEERSDWQYPVRSLLASGARVSFGSDWPVSSLAPLEGIAVATTRQMPDGSPPGGWRPAERVSREVAVAAYTAGSAHQLRAHGSGRLAPGAPADLCVLDRALDDVADAALGTVSVAETWLRGRVVSGG